MRTSLIIALVGLGSIVASQEIDLEFVNDTPDPPAPKVLADQLAQDIKFDPAEAIAIDVADLRKIPVAESDRGNLQARPVIRKRGASAIELVVSEQACDSINGTLYGDLEEDSEEVRVQKFLKNTTLQKLALDAATPSNYTLVFQNLTNSSQANGYLGYSVLSSYNVSECAVKCSNKNGCQAFNIYLERDPSAVPGPGCERPPAIINSKCALWGGSVSAGNALNAGQYREQFHVVMTASNGYVLSSVLGSFSNSAILAPLDCNGNDSYMGMRLLTDGAPFSPERCAAICNETTQYNIAHPPADPAKAPQLCTFYNTFVLEKNFVSQGQYCAMYSQSWDPNAYARNNGQYDKDGNHFTISSSFFSGNISYPLCPADIESLQGQNSVNIFCTSYISYIAPAATRTTITSTSVLETCSNPTLTTSPALDKRDASIGEIVGAVVAIYPDKVADTAITGSTPAEITISAQDLFVAAAYSSATSEALHKLDALETTSSLQITYQATPSPTNSVHKRQGALIPDLLSGRDYREVSSACSRIVNTSTPTLTYYAPDVTERPAIDCSDFSTCSDGSPPALMSGSFTNASYRVDDIYYNITLPFPICIYDTCSSIVRPSSNGIITLGDYATSQYNNEANGIPAAFAGDNAVLYVYWDDLYIFPGQRHSISYSICGSQGARNVTFLWKLGHYNTEGPVFDGKEWQFSATFYEAPFVTTKGVSLRYYEIPDNGTSASIGAQGVLNGQSISRKLDFSKYTSYFPNGLYFEYR